MGPTCSSYARVAGLCLTADRCESSLTHPVIHKSCPVTRPSFWWLRDSRELLKDGTGQGFWDHLTVCFHCRCPHDLPPRTRVKGCLQVPDTTELHDAVGDPSPPGQGEHFLGIHMWENFWKRGMKGLVQRTQSK